MFIPPSFTLLSAPSAGGGTAVSGGTPNSAKKASRRNKPATSHNNTPALVAKQEQTPALGENLSTASALGESQELAPTLGASQNQESVLGANRSQKPMPKSLNFGQRVWYLFSNEVCHLDQVKKYNSNILSHVHSQDVIIRDCEKTIRNCETQISNCEKTIRNCETQISELREDNESLDQTCQELQIDLTKSLDEQARLVICEIELKEIKPKFEELESQLAKSREILDQVVEIKNMTANEDKGIRTEGLRRFHILQFQQDLANSTSSLFSAESTSPPKKAVSFEDLLADFKSSTTDPQRTCPESGAAEVQSLQRTLGSDSPLLLTSGDTGI